MFNRIFAFVLILMVFLALPIAQAKSDKSKYKLQYTFNEGSARTYLISYKIATIDQDDKKFNSVYALKVEDTVTKASKSKATIKRVLKGFKLSREDQIFYDSLSSEKNEDNEVVSEVFKALENQSFEFKVSNTGKVSGISGYKDVYKNALENIFGKSKKSDDEAKSDLVQKLLTTWLDKAFLEAEISYVYMPLTKSSVKADSTWKSKSTRRLSMTIDYDSPEEFKIESINKKNDVVSVKGKLRGELEKDETKTYKLEYNKCRREFEFDQTAGEMVKFHIETKAKYFLDPVENDEDEEEQGEVEFQSSSEIEQTVDVELLSSSTTGNPKVKIITNMGDFTVELFEDEMPNTVANFIELCEAKFYDDIRFHRVIKDFMIQVGCPYAKGEVTARAGSGDAGYKFADENLEKAKFTEKGLLAMANSGPNTNGSQIFITLAATNWLDGKHAVFGKVVEGMDIVEKIGNVQTVKPSDKPVNEIYIKETKILQKRNHEYKVKRLN